MIYQMSVFSQKFKKTFKKVTAWTLSALTALTCTAALPVITSTPVAAAELSNEDRGVLFASSRSDFRDESIYFLITTRFYDGDPSNNEHCVDDVKAKNPDSDPAWRGDFKGLIDKLDYIKALGFTAIWITPVVKNRSSYDYHGYHAYDFTAVDNRYESNGVTYQDLIDACHAKGMKVIQDVVFNHSCNWGEKNLCPIEIDVWSPNGRSDMPMPAGTKMDPDKIYHHDGYAGGGDFDNYNVQIMTLHSDCFDLNTENPKVYNYLIDCYKKFIDMGVDAFRVDTVKHLSRLTLNKTFVPALREEYKKVHTGSGYDDFYMFGEVCTKGESTWYREQPPISTCFYTWADDDSWLSKWTSDPDANVALTKDHYDAHMDMGSQPTTDNALLRGNDYHTPDYSQRSGLDSIDFQMHWQFDNAGQAFGMAKEEDPYFNDSTWSVTYVNSHDYSPNNCQTIIPEFDEETWAEDLALIFTFRGIPCIYYGTEIRFQHGKPIDVGPNAPLSETGRAYFGDNIEGEINASGFTVYTATGAAKSTLEAPLAQHLIRLNRLRQAIPALRKGQYSTEGCGGGLAFKRRYTDANTDSFVCVTISGSTTFTGVPNGTYVDAVTGDTQTVSGGTLTATCTGKGNLRVYVLSTSKTPAPGRVVPNGAFMGDGGAATIIGGEIVDVDIVEATGVTLSKSSVTVLEGESASVTATVAPSNATNKSVKWTTSDASVATVSGGVIKGVSKGTATITATTHNNLTATVKVTVSENTNIVKPTGVTIAPTSLKLQVGETGDLTATVAPANATDKTVTWSSSSDAVAKVSNGTVTAVGTGTATITATTSNGKTATASVTVEGPSMTYIDNGVYFQKPSGWGAGVNIYIYDGDKDETIGTSWPGTAMKDGGNGIYYYEFKPTVSNVKLVFNSGSNQAPTDKGFDFKNKGLYTDSGFSKIIEKPSQVEVTGVSLDKTSASVKVGATVTFSASVAPSNATDKSVTWSSSDTSVASVSNGVVTGKAVGTATITASSSNGKKATATVTVSKDVVVSGLENKSTISATSISKGSSVTMKGAASGGTTPYQYAYVVQAPNGNWTVLKDYSTATRHTWTPASTGTYTVQIKVKDNAGTVKAKSFTLNVSTSAALANNSTISATSISKGSSVTMKGAASGGTTPYKYAYVVQAPNGNWTVLKDYSTATSYTWTPASTGKYTVQVKVKDSKSTVSTKSFTLNVTAAFANNSKISATKIEKGSSVKMTGAASGGTSPYKYAYVVQAPNGNWTVLKDYSTATSYTWTPASLGSYKVQIKAKDSKNTVKVKEFTLTVSNPLVNNSKISATSIAKGQSVKLTGAATGGTGYYQYAFVAQSPDGNWHVLQNYSTTATYTFKPASVGKYTVQVKIKDNLGALKVKSFSLNVSNALVNNSQVSTVSITKGQSVTFTGAAAGGTAPYQYAYVVQAPNGNWTVLKDYSTATSHTWTPASTGKYTLQIKVKDSKGTVSTKSFTLNVDPTPLTNKSTVSATSATRSNGLTVTGAAVGGTSPYQYALVYRLSSSSSYSIARNYSTTKTMTFKPSQAGTYYLVVKVKDNVGTVVEKTFKVTIS